MIAFAEVRGRSILEDLDRALAGVESER